MTNKHGVCVCVCPSSVLSETIRRSQPFRPLSEQNDSEQFCTFRRSVLDRIQFFGLGQRSASLCARVLYYESPLRDLTLYRDKYQRYGSQSRHIAVENHNGWKRYFLLPPWVNAVRISTTIVLGLSYCSWVEFGSRLGIAPATAHFDRIQNLPSQALRLKNCGTRQVTVTGTNSARTLPDLPSEKYVATYG
jgi:hypothetical protein